MLALNDVNATAEGEPRSRLFLFEVRLKILLASPDCGHETDAVPLRHGAGPTFHLHETPIGKIVDLSSLVRLGGEKEELHSFFLHPNLGHAAHFIVVEDAGAERLEFREFSRDIVMFELMLHEEEVAQRSRVRLQRIEQHRAVRGGDGQEAARLVGAGKIVETLVDSIAGDSRNDEQRNPDRNHDRIAHDLFPAPPRDRDETLFHEPFSELRVDWNIANEFRDGRVERLLRSEEHTSELQSLAYLVCRLLLEKKTQLTPH